MNKDFERFFKHAIFVSNVFDEQSTRPLKRSWFGLMQNMYVHLLYGTVRYV